MGDARWAGPSPFRDHAFPRIDPKDHLGIRAHGIGNPSTAATDLGDHTAQWHGAAQILPRKVLAVPQRVSLITDVHLLVCAMPVFNHHPLPHQVRQAQLASLGDAAPLQRRLAWVRPQQDLERGSSHVQRPTVRALDLAPQALALLEQVVVFAHVPPVVQACAPFLDGDHEVGPRRPDEPIPLQCIDSQLAHDDSCHPRLGFDLVRVLIGELCYR
mmetsp:Transcript_850/g.2661  ORF Transcript_850/g.2661 Transcript_850/m.2661 type:complete len:215 (-) Transcript_850:448-1092(-)